MRREITLDIGPHPKQVKFNRDPITSTTYNYSDVMSIKSKLKHLHVGGNATFENISGALMLKLLQECKNYRVYLVDSFGNLATMYANGNSIYVVTNRNFVHYRSYTATEVTVVDATRHSDKGFRVYSASYTYDSKVVFPRVKFTRLHFWKRIKPPKVI